MTESVNTLDLRNKYTGNFYIEVYKTTDYNTVVYSFSKEYENESTIEKTFENVTIGPEYYIKTYIDKDNDGYDDSDPVSNVTMAFDQTATL